MVGSKSQHTEEPVRKGRVVELFAGVGGFGLGLERSGEWEVVWANQWEPSTKKQHAFECLVKNIGPRVQPVCMDIAKVLDEVELGQREIPDHDLVVGGFPCQDYSVAATQAQGIRGEKGVLWWEIHRFLKLHGSELVVLENVDRLLKSPSKQRGRDFAVMLACLAQLGYFVEWRVINAADYGFPQKRRRVFIVAMKNREALTERGLFNWLVREGVLARAFPVERPLGDFYSGNTGDFVIDFTDIVGVSDSFGNPKKTAFRNAGVMVDGVVLTRELRPEYRGPRKMLGDCLLPDSEVPEEYFVPEAELKTWVYLKGAKRESRYHKGSKTPYYYVEGAIPFPDPIDRPARTIMTSEGGKSPSRFKHIVQTSDGRYRRLTPVELERLNGFPDGWTAGLSNGRRAFCMGNALVVGVVERIGEELAQVARELGVWDCEYARTSSGANLGGRLPLDEGQCGSRHEARATAET